MDVEHKDRITKLETKSPTTSLEQREERTKELRAFTSTIALHLEDAQKLLDDTTTTWTTMEDIDDLVNVRE